MPELETDHLKLPYIAAAQAQKHVTHNEALRRLDTVVQLAVLDATLTGPPAEPGDGDRHIVADAASGAWLFSEPGEGWLAFDLSAETLLVHLSGAWTPFAGGMPDTVEQLGVNATADETNRLAVRSEAVLFSGIEDAEGGSGDIRFTVNKEADADTASLLFQSGWSGRAEVGLVGDTDFVFKVSADGEAWVDAIRIDKDTGLSTILYDNGGSGLAATTVQDAIDEVVAGAGGGAVDVPIADTAENFTADDVEGALAELADGLSSHVSDTDNPHSVTAAQVGAATVVADRTALKALAVASVTTAYLKEAGRAGVFLFDASDLSTEVTADTEEGIHVAPASDATGASGAWVRQGVAVLAAYSTPVDSPPTGVVLFSDSDGRLWSRLTNGRLIHHGAVGGARRTETKASNTGSATIQTLGAGGAASMGTATGIGVSATNRFTRTVRVQGISAASAGVDTGFRAGDFRYLADNGIVKIVFGWEDFQANATAFVGMRSGTAFGDVDASSLTNIFGVGIDSGETTWHVMHNDGSGAATKVDLGANFPANTDAADLYELMLWWSAGGAVVNYQLTRLGTDFVAVGVISINLPATTTALNPQVIGNTRSGSAALSISFSEITSETV